MKLTNKDFGFFKKECKKWVDKLGLGGWDINYGMRDLKDNRAQLTAVYSGNLATITLNSDVDAFFFPDGSITKQAEIKSSARHEMLELFLYRLRAMAFDRSIDSGEWDAETHQIIHTLERIL